MTETEKYAEQVLRRLIAEAEVKLPWYHRFFCTASYQTHKYRLKKFIDQAGQLNHHGAISDTLKVKLAEVLSTAEPLVIP